MGFRPTPEIRAKLEAAAERNNRSLSQEIESRLEKSFTTEEVQEATFGGKHIHALMRLLSATVTLAEAETGRKWSEDRATFEAAKLSMDGLLKYFAPSGPRVDLPHLQDKADALLSIVHSIRSPTIAALIRALPDLERSLQLPDGWRESRSRVLREINKAQ